MTDLGDWMPDRPSRTQGQDARRSCCLVLPPESKLRGRSSRSNADEQNRQIFIERSVRS